MKVAIIGAGISGVSLAYYLSEYGKAGVPLEISVFDKNEVAGGCIRSVEGNGFRVESGPNGVLNSKTHFRDLFVEAGLEDQLIYSSDLTARRYIQLNNQIHLAPQNPVAAIKTPLLSFAAKMRILREPFISANNSDEDESVYSFAARRLGEQTAENLISTLVGGIYAGDAHKLSIKYAFPRLYNLEREHGGLIKGMFGKMREAMKNPDKPRRIEKGKSSTLISSINGMQGIVTSLATKCNGVIFHYNSNVTRLEKRDSSYIVHENGVKHKFDKVVLCCNAHDAASITDNIDHELAHAFGKVQFAPVFVCGMGFDKADVLHALDGFGYLVAPKENKIVLGTLFSSSLFAGRAPAGKTLLTVITVGDRNRERFGDSEEALTHVVFEQVKDVLGIQKMPETVLTFKTEHAIPQYQLGYSEIVEIIASRTSLLSGLYIGGNTIGGISVADCVLTSRNIADRIYFESK